MVLDIVKKNKDIGFDDIIIQMKKRVRIRGDLLIKLVDEILKWWEEGGKILQMVDLGTRMGIYRMNENTKIAKDIIDEALGELGISKTSEESLTESDNITEARGYRKVKDLDRTKSLWELRTLYGMSYLVVSYSPQVDETAVFKADRNGKILSYSEVYSTRGRLEPEPIIRDIASGKIKPFDWGIDEATLDEAVVAKKSEKFKAGIPKWFHTVFTGMSKYPSQLIAGWKTELKTGSGMPGYMTYVLHYDGVGTYTVYHNKGRGLKVEINGDKPLGNFRSPEEAMDFVEKNALSEKIK